MRILAPRTASTKIKTVFFAGLLAFGLSVTWAVMNPQAARVFAADCDENAIMYCGFSSNSDFISKVSRNNDGHGHTDLQTIYNHYGLATNEYSRFQSSAKDGTMYRDGRVVVGSDVVMTSGKTLGRQYFNGSSSVSIGGKTYYHGTPDVRWVPGTASMPVKVMFNASGTAEIVILTSCGNPVDGPEVESGAACKLLNATPVSGKLNTYRFTATATATGNAKITKYIYDFGDGSPSVTKTSPTDPVEHTYTKAGDVTAKVTVVASAPGGTTIQSTAETCKKKLTIVAPYYECVKLTGALANPNDKYTYVYTATLKYGNGAQLVGVKFDFGDSTNTMVKAANVTTVTAKHTYTAGKDYRVQAFAQFNVNGKTVTAPTCKMTQTVINPYYRCVQLTGNLTNKDNFSYRFVVTMDYGNGAQFVSADFDFGDGKTTTGVKSTDGKTVTVDHTYGKSAEYSVGATLKFTVNNKAVSAPTCRAHVPKEGTPAVPECKPGIPEGDVRCTPCPYDSTIPASDTERCVAPVTELPNTGAGNIIALGTVALVGGFLAYRHFLFKKHKAAFMATDRGEAPLPLADPLQPDNPLAATPLAEPAQKRRLSLRRRRQF